KAANVTTRYMAPVSRTANPSSRATPRATVDLPTPEGPSIATTFLMRAWGSSSVAFAGAPQVREVVRVLGIRHPDRIPPSDNRTPRGRDGRGRGREREAMVAVALERRGTGRATLNDEAIRQRFGADAEAIQQVEHGGDAVALLDAQLGEVVDLRWAIGEGRRYGNGGNLVDERLGALDDRAGEWRALDLDVTDWLAEALAALADGDARAHASQDVDETEPAR